MKMSPWWLLFGAVAASLLIDHFGLFGFVTRPMTLLRLSGVGCVLGGMLLIQAGRPSHRNPAP